MQNHSISPDDDDETDVMMTSDEGCHDFDVRRRRILDFCDFFHTCPKCILRPLFLPRSFGSARRHGKKINSVIDATEDS